MNFPLGRAPTAMLVLLLLSAPVIVLRGATGGAQLNVWVFAQTHYEGYKPPIARFQARHPGIHVKMTHIPLTGMTDKLASAFMSDTGAPDVLMMEIGPIGRFFQGRASDIGFVDLTDRLKAEGYYDKIIQARYRPWSSRGRVYGIPLDLHPAVLMYRQDLFGKVGIDLSAQVETWEEFLRVLERPGVLDFRKDGRRDRYGLILNQTNGDQFRLLLLQRGGDYFDGEDNVTVDSPIVVDTLRWYRELFQEDHIVYPWPANWGPDVYGPMKEDRLLACIAPDWFVGFLKINAPELAGKWRAMPLPAWEPGGRRTSTWGGTMNAMTKQTRNPELAWELLKSLSFDRDSLADNYSKTYILPAYTPVWTEPTFHEPDPYVGGQKLGELLIRLAPDLPPVNQNKYAAETAQLLGLAIYRCIRQGADPAVELKSVGTRIRARREQDRFRD